MEKPKTFFKSAFDICCGLQLRYKEPALFFSDFSGGQPGKVNYREFTHAVANLGVQLSERQSFFMHKYMLDKQARRAVADRQRLGEEESQQMAFLQTEYVDCDFLRDCLFEEVPFGQNEVKMQDQVVKIITERLSESMVPILDVIDVFRQTFTRDMDPEFNRNNVTLIDFREKILGDYLKLTNAISHN